MLRSKFENRSSSQGSRRALTARWGTPLWSGMRIRGVAPSSAMGRDDSEGARRGLATRKGSRRRPRRSALDPGQCQQRLSISNEAAAELARHSISHSGVYLWKALCHPTNQAAIGNTHVPCLSLRRPAQPVLNLWSAPLSEHSQRSARKQLLIVLGNEGRTVDMIQRQCTAPRIRDSPTLGMQFEHVQEHIVRTAVTPDAPASVALRVWSRVIVRRGRDDAE